MCSDWGVIGVYAFRNTTADLRTKLESDYTVASADEE